MKNKIAIALAVLALNASVFVACAQDTNGPANAGRGPGGHRPPPSPLMQALDANHDGVIDADEIANAPAALKTLDKNGDGVLTRDEICPPPPPRDGQNPPDDQPPGPPPQQ